MHEDIEAVEKVLKGILTIRTVLMSPVVVLLTWIAFPDEFKMSATITRVRWRCCALATLLGLLSPSQPWSARRSTTGRACVFFYDVAATEHVAVASSCRASGPVAAQHAGLDFVES